MAPRKDTMRIIRQDAGFSATLGFGGLTAPVAQSPVHDTDAHKPNTSVLSAPAQNAGRADQPISALQDGLSELPGAAQIPLSQRVQQNNKPIGSSSAARGHVVYVAVSLTTRQAALAEAWAEAGRCTVPFLIRHVAQGIRDQVCRDWQDAGMPLIDGPRGTRGKFPTSVTLTLRPQFAAELAALHDPLGLIGLGRAMGPAFRARFQAAFDEALAKANIQSVKLEDEQ